jgi:pimeloyl-ACP methyl ester carboxylesterase
MPDDPRDDAMIRRSRLEERFVDTRDGHSIFVRTWTPAAARGAPLVLTDGLGCQGYAWAYVIDAFKHGHPIVYWQYRGHGRSPVPTDLSTLSVQSCVNDLEDVLNATGIDQAVFIGHSMGVQVVLEAMRSMAARAAGLVLVCGGHEYPIRTWHGSPQRDGRPTVANLVMRAVFPHLSGSFLTWPDRAQRVWERLVPTRLSYSFATRVEVNGRRIDRRDFWPYLKHIGTMDMRVFATLAQDLAEHSASDMLADISSPTLVIGAGRDTFTPVWLSEEMWRRIPEAEYLFIPDGTHATPVEHPELINLRLEKFLRERVASAGSGAPASDRSP